MWRRRPQRRFGRRLGWVAKAVGGGYCRLRMPLRPALGVRGTVAGRRLGTPEPGGTSTPSNTSPPLGHRPAHTHTRASHTDAVPPDECVRGIVTPAGPPRGVHHRNRLHEPTAKARQPGTSPVRGLAFFSRPRPSGWRGLGRRRRLGGVWCGVVGVVGMGGCGVAWLVWLAWGGVVWRGWCGWHGGCGVAWLDMISNVADARPRSSGLVLYVCCLGFAPFPPPPRRSIGLCESAPGQAKQEEAEKQRRRRRGKGRGADGDDEGSSSDDDDDGVRPCGAVSCLLRGGTRRVYSPVPCLPAGVVLGASYVARARVCARACAFVKLPDTCRHLPKPSVTPADTCRGRCSRQACSPAAALGHGTAPVQHCPHLFVWILMQRLARCFAKRPVVRRATYQWLMESRMFF